MGKKWVEPERTWLEKAEDLAKSLKGNAADYREWATVIHESPAKRRRADLALEQQCQGEYLSDIMVIERAPRTEQKAVDAALAALASAKAKLAVAKRAKGKAKGLRILLKAAQAELDAVKALEAALPDKVPRAKRSTGVNT
jgi:hypothetical protein